MTALTIPTEAIPATREQELRILVERIIDGDFSGLPKVEWEFYGKPYWIDAAQRCADVAGEPEDAAQALGELERMIVREALFQDWMRLSEREQDRWQEFSNYFDARAASVGEAA